MKKLNLLIIGILMILIIFSSCNIVVNRWAIDWNDEQLGSSTNTIKIYNKTGETIDSIKYFVGDYPPDWSNVTSTIGVTIADANNTTVTLGTSGTINCNANDTVWIRVAAEVAWNASKLYASDGFTYESNDVWNMYVYKE